MSMKNTEGETSSEHLQLEMVPVFYISAFSEYEFLFNKCT